MTAKNKRKSHCEEQSDEAISKTKQTNCELFEILDETEDLLVVNKTGDLVCHPTKGDAYSSLISRLRLYWEGQPEVRPSFVNRLDRETSGVILISKNAQTHASMQKAFQNGDVEKVYFAIVHGVPSSKEGEVCQPLGREPGSIVTIKQAVLSDGAPSTTHWKLHQAFAPFSILEVRPQTGRLHQIRVHLSFIGHPLVGDKLYGPDPGLYLEFVRNGWSPDLEKQLLTPRQMLHAAELRISDKASGHVWHWKAPMPQDMRDFILQKNLKDVRQN